MVSIREKRCHNAHCTDRDPCNSSFTPHYYPRHSKYPQCVRLCKENCLPKVRNELQLPCIRAMYSCNMCGDHLSSTREMRRHAESRCCEGLAVYDCIKLEVQTLCVEPEVVEQLARGWGPALKAPYHVRRPFPSNPSVYSAAESSIFESETRSDQQSVFQLGFGRPRQANSQLEMNFDRSTRNSLDFGRLGRPRSPARTEEAFSTVTAATTDVPPESFVSTKSSEASSAWPAVDTRQMYSQRSRAPRAPAPPSSSELDSYYTEDDSEFTQFRNHPGH